MRATAWGIVIAAAALLGGEARAQAPAPEPGRVLPAGDQARDGAKLPERELAGVVAEVRPAEGVIRVKADDGADREIAVRSGTEITVDGRRATLEEVHPGAEIRASLRGAELAMRIEVGPGLAAPEPAPRDDRDGEPDAATREADEAAESAPGEQDAPDR